MRFGSRYVGSDENEFVRFDAGGVKKAANVFRWGTVLVAFLCGLGAFWTGVWVFALLNLALLVVVRGLIIAYPAGVYVRNVFSEFWFPWNTIERFEARSLVRIVDVDGGAHDCIAVQRANISAVLGRVSRVDRAVAILEEIHAVRGERDGHGDTVQRATWLSIWEWVQVLFVPAAALLGIWVST